MLTFMYLNLKQHSSTNLLSGFLPCIFLVYDVCRSPMWSYVTVEEQIIGAVGAEVWVWNRNRGGLVTHKMGGHSNPLYCLW